MDAQKWLRFLIAWIGIGLGVGVQPAPGAEFLEVSFERTDDAGSFAYFISFSANKSGATTSRLQTPRGNYDGVPLGDGWIPEASFWTDHRELSFAELESVIGMQWLLTWDQGLSTETVAHIGYGSVLETQFPIVPVITQPADGATGVAPDVSIEWDYGGNDPCSPPVDRVEVCLIEAPPYQCFEMDTCSVLAWSPPSPFSTGSHTVAVTNGVDIRDVAGGIGGPILGDPWVLENSEWLALVSADVSSFEVSASAVEDSGFGRLKASYR